jgi:hypothetical protein
LPRFMRPMYAGANMGHPSKTLSAVVALRVAFQNLYCSCFMRVRIQSL